ncbi:MAG TPA: hypothetical protein VNR37_03400 [Microbacteriaceae bacterium]|nr:hypothetical protein [Microbacteriaceae bacterium]
MARQFIAIVTVEDGTTFNQIREAAQSFIECTPMFVEAVRFTEAREYRLPPLSEPTPSVGEE